MGIKINFKGVPVIFLNAFEKAKDSTDKEGKIIKGRYQFTPILPKKDPQIRMMESKILEYLSGPDGLKSEEAAEKWMSKNFGFTNHSDKCAVRDLSERDKPIEGYEEGLYFRAASHKPFKVLTSLGEVQIDPNKSRLASGEKSFPRGLTVDGDDIEGKEVYGGCIANVSVEFWWSKDWKNLCCTALGIRFREDGQAFGGGSSEYASDDDLGDDDDAPKSKRRSHDDEDEKPTRSRRSRDEDDEDDEDERPRRRRNRDED